jgi:hypothetical protein
MSNQNLLKNLMLNKISYNNLFCVCTWYKRKSELDYFKNLNYLHVDIEDMQLQGVQRL